MASFDLLSYHFSFHFSTPATLGLCHFLSLFRHSHTSRYSHCFFQNPKAHLFTSVRALFTFQGVLPQPTCMTQQSLTSAPLSCSCLILSPQQLSPTSGLCILSFFALFSHSSHSYNMGLMRVELCFNHGCVSQVPGTMLHSSQHSITICWMNESYTHHLCDSTRR